MTLDWDRFCSCNHSPRRCAQQKAIANKARSVSIRSNSVRWVASKSNPWFFKALNKVSISQRHLSSPGMAVTREASGLRMMRDSPLIKRVPVTESFWPQTTRCPLSRSVTIFCETRNGIHPISGAKNQATAMAFGGPRSSCVRPGAHSARRHDSRKDLTPCRMALHFVSAGAHAPHSDETPGPTATQGSSHSARRLRSLAFLCSSLDDFAACQVMKEIAGRYRAMPAPSDACVVLNANPKFYFIFNGGSEQIPYR